MSSVLYLYKDNDMVVELDGLKNEVSGEYINDATVTFTLKTVAGVTVTGQSFPAAMPYVPASNGLYRATLSDAVAITKGVRYTVEINVDAGSGLSGKWEIDSVCQTRK
jgi:hypothetical protein